MWTITLGYYDGIVPYHWQLVLRHQPTTDDTSLECPSDCDDDQCNHFDHDNFKIDRFDQIAPFYAMHAVHVERWSSDRFTFEHKTRDFGEDVRESKFLGTFPDACLRLVIERCKLLEMPAGNHDENCQDWVWNALYAISGVAKLESDHQEILSGMVTKEAEGRT